MGTLNDTTAAAAAEMKTIPAELLEKYLAVAAESDCDKPEISLLLATLRLLPEDDVFDFLRRYAEEISADAFFTALTHLPVEFLERLILKVPDFLYPADPENLEILLDAAAYLGPERTLVFFKGMEQHVADFDRVGMAARLANEAFGNDFPDTYVALLDLVGDGMVNREVLMSPDIPEELLTRICKALADPKREGGPWQPTGGFLAEAASINPGNEVSGILKVEFFLRFFGHTMSIDELEKFANLLDADMFRERETIEDFMDARVASSNM